MIQPTHPEVPEESDQERAYRCLANVSRPSTAAKINRSQTKFKMNVGFLHGVNKAPGDDKCRYWEWMKKQIISRRMILPLGRASGKHQLQNSLWITINDNIAAIEAAGLLNNVADGISQIDTTKQQTKDTTADSNGHLCRESSDNIMKQCSEVACTLNTCTICLWWC